MVAQIRLKSTPVTESQNVLEMDTPEYMRYANNNNNNIYTPGLPQSVPNFPHPVPVHASSMPTMPSSIYQNIQMGQNVSTNFTFTNPTQGSVISYAMPLYTAPMSAMGFTPVSCLPPRSRIVPGIGAQWQHTVPQNMPWAIGQLGNNYVTEFTAQLPLQYPLPPLVSTFEPKASCSFTQRRPKRQFVDHDEESIPVTKMHVTDEMMMSRMKGLYITAPDTTEDTSDNLQSSWQKFRDLEDRLEDDAMCDVTGGASGTTTQVRCRLPRLRLKGGINPQDLLKPNHILPKTILNDLNKPCMEVVLWKPPGLVRNIEDIMSHNSDQLNMGSSEDRSLPSRSLQQTVTTVTSSVPSLSYGDRCIPDMSMPSCAMENVCAMDDDMDL